MKVSKLLAAASVLCVWGAGIASAQTWAPLTNSAPAFVGAMVQLRDGRVMVHEEQSGNSRNWWFLTPDSTGSYQNGTWSGPTVMPSNYSPWFFASQVLLDGKHVLV